MIPEIFLTMVCGMQGRIARRENLLSGHDRFLLLKDEAEYIIDNMAAGKSCIAS